MLGSARSTFVYCSNSFQFPGLVPFDLCRKFALFSGIYAYGAPMWHFMDTRSIWGGPLGSTSGRTHFEKKHPTPKRDLCGEPLVKLQNIIVLLNFVHQPNVSCKPRSCGVNSSCLELYFLTNLGTNWVHNQEILTIQK